VLESKTENDALLQEVLGGPPCSPWMCGSLEFRTKSKVRFPANSRLDGLLLTRHAQLNSEIGVRSSTLRIVFAIAMASSVVGLYLSLNAIS
jgi:hypothetical protein